MQYIVMFVLLEGNCFLHALVDSRVCIATRTCKQRYWQNLILMQLHFSLIV
jgi:hypothetical protein